MNHKSLLLLSLIISFGIIMGCFLIYSKPLSVSTVPKSKNTVESSVMLDLDKASEFLGLTKGEIKKIVSIEKRSFENGGFDGALLPYITVDGNLYFEKTKLLLWAQENAAIRKEYNSGDNR